MTARRAAAPRANIERRANIEPVWQVPALAQTPKLRHGFFGREGGCSRGLYASLNCGLGSRDARADVQENRARVQKYLRADALATPRQTHSIRVATITDATETDIDADALITATPNLAIGVVAADCAPLLLFAPDARRIAAAHAGWRGAVAGLVGALVDALEAQGADARQLLGGIGPCISPAAYEVGEDMRATACQQCPEAAAHFATAAGKLTFDLAGLLAAQLQARGCAPIARSPLCTASEPKLLFSFRRGSQAGDSDYGRQIAALCLA